MRSNSIFKTTLAATTRSLLGSFGTPHSASRLQSHPRSSRSLCNPPHRSQPSLLPPPRTRIATLVAAKTAPVATAQALIHLLYPPRSAQRPSQTLWGTNFFSDIKQDDKVLRDQALEAAEKVGNFRPQMTQTWKVSGRRKAEEVHGQVAGTDE